jgi:hypothetical protein
MDNKGFSKELEKRTQKFAVRTIRLSLALPNTPEGKVIKNQISKTRLKYAKVKPVKHNIGWK